MSAYMTETEQLEEIKKWWLRHQRAITTALFVILLAVSGYRYWDSHTKKMMEQASMAYQSMMYASSSHDDQGTQSYANRLVTDYSKTVYASAAHLMLAKVFIKNDNYEKAADELGLVAHHATMDALKEVATVRLARLYLAQKQYDKALKELEAVENSTYSAIASELQGDIFVAKGDYTKAAHSYAEALQSMQSFGATNRYLEMKHSAVASMVQSKFDPSSESKTV